MKWKLHDYSLILTPSKCYFTRQKLNNQFYFLYIFCYLKQGLPHLEGNSFKRLERKKSFPKDPLYWKLLKKNANNPNWKESRVTKTL